jgi:hypothetical protein
MSAWNLALRFALEVGALIALAIAAWTLTSSPVRWAAVVVVPAIAVASWGIFNVLDDPSRSGQAPVEVAGWLRLAIEFAVLGGGAAALALAGQPLVALGMALLLVVHYAASWSRVTWLLGAAK